MDGSNEREGWRDEAKAIIQDVSNHVRQIFISERLPSNEREIYMNCETTEGNKFTIRLSAEGYQAVGNAFDTCLDMDAKAYETPYALLSVISAGYTVAFGTELCKALHNLAKDN